LPFGYRVRFTIEEQPTATCRHLSIAVDESGMMPNPEAVRALMQEFGFVTSAPPRAGRRGDPIGRGAGPKDSPLVVWSARDIVY